MILTQKIEPPEVRELKKIQENFNEYQNKAFPKREPQFFALELAGECGELANCEKKLWRDATADISKNKLEDEAADVFIALINYCNTRDINLETSVQNKLTVIEKRRLEGKMGAFKNGFPPSQE